MRRGSDGGFVGADPEALVRAERLLRLARETAELATSVYVHSSDLPEARESLVVAMAAQAQAEALFETMRNL